MHVFNADKLHYYEAMYLLQANPDTRVQVKPHEEETPVLQHVIFEYTGVKQTALASNRISPLALDKFFESCFNDDNEMLFAHDIAATGAYVTAFENLGRCFFRIPEDSGETLFKRACNLMQTIENNVVTLTIKKGLLNWKHAAFNVFLHNDLKNTPRLHMNVMCGELNAHAEFPFYVAFFGLVWEVMRRCYYDATGALVELGTLTITVSSLHLSGTKLLSLITSFENYHPGTSENKDRVRILNRWIEKFYRREAPELDSDIANIREAWAYLKDHDFNGAVMQGCVLMDRNNKLVAKGFNTNWLSAGERLLFDLAKTVDVSDINLDGHTLYATHCPLEMTLGLFEKFGLTNLVYDEETSGVADLKEFPCIKARQVHAKQAK